MSLPELRIRRTRQGRDRRTRAQKRKEKLKETQHKTDSALQQQKITQYAKAKYSADPGAGDQITMQKAITDLRVFLQNPNGVMGNDTKLDNRRALLSLREWGVDVVALPETNKNWKKAWLRNRWKSEVQRVWRHSKIVFTSMDVPADPMADYQQGGACMIVTGAWASRVMEHGSDRLGRWVWATLRGRQQEKMTVVTMYRPNRGSPSSGPATVWSQQKSRLQELASEPTSDSTIDPRRQCLEDFGLWVDNRVLQGHKMVILTDANQSLHDKSETYNLCNFMQDRALSSAMEVRHEGQSLRSLNRGSVTIDHVLLGGVNSESLHKVGQLPFGLGFHTDHRGVFADLDGDQLLRLKMEEPEHREGRRLSSQNNKHREVYMQHLIKHLEAHNLFQRAGELSKLGVTGELDTVSVEEYNKIDECITEGMIAAENKLPRRREHGWTAELNRLIHKIRYYRLLLRRNRCLPTHENIMRKVREVAGVTWDSCDEYQIKQRLRTTWKQLDKYQKTMVEKRDKYMQELANATGAPDREKAIRLIRSREATARQFRRIRNTLGRLRSGGLAGVDVPVVSAEGEIEGWRSVTGSEELHEVVTQRNLRHLNQAASTPMGSGEGYNKFHGDERHETARKVLSGEMDWQHPVEEVNKFIENLRLAFDKDHMQVEAKKINAPVTAGEFRHFFKGKKESTESSPSGRHIGHYKSILNSDEVVELIVSMINIGLNTGISLNRWQQTISVMLEKDKGRPKINRLRIIQLFEADYNFVLSLVLGHRLMNFARRHCGFNESQYGSLKGKQAQSAILNKILTYDYFRMRKENAATAEFDAAANYDRILPAIAVIACRRLGLATKIGDLFFHSLNKLKHKVRTLYGLSTEYGPTVDLPLYGTGQGSGGSPTFWAVIADVLFKTMDEYGTGLDLVDPTGRTKSRRNEDGYVDDTSLGVDGRDSEVVGRLTMAAQRHERILYATGGKLALEKCTWVLIHWMWSEGVATMDKYDNEEGDGPSTHKLRLVQSETGGEVDICRLEPSEAYRTLGAWIAADGQQNKQMEVFAATVAVWINGITRSSLTTKEKQVAYSAFLKPQITYPIGCASIEQTELKRVFRPVLDIILHTLGLNKHFPLALVHAGPDDLGLGIDDLPTIQGVAQLQLLMGHLNKADRTGTLLEITLGVLELEIGLGKCPLWWPHTTTLEHVSDTWLTSIGRFLHRHHCRVEMRTKRPVQAQRGNDKFLMQVALDGNFKLVLIQQCRIWLQVATLADICDAAGRRVEKWAFTRRGRVSKMIWSRQGEPGAKAWREWRRLLSSLVTDARYGGGRHLKSCYRMKEWRSTHQIWDWMGDAEAVVTNEGARFWREGTKLVAMDEKLQYIFQKVYPLDVHASGSGERRVRDPGCTRESPGTNVDVYARLRGRVLPTANGPEFADQEDNIVIATDGTVRDGNGGAAYSIHTTETPGSIRAVLPVDGKYGSLSSYRTELFGILGSLLLLSHLLKSRGGTWDRLSAVLWCDNEAAVNKFNKLEGKRHYSIASANHADADILQELRWWKNQLPINVRAAWVKSHQTTRDTREGRLNHIADRLAATQHEATGKWATGASSDMLPQTKAQLHLPQGRYTGRVNEKIQHALWGQRAENYVLAKLELSYKELVDWEMLGRHHRRLSWQRRATRLKMIFRWAPTNARNFIVGTSETPMCPLCGSERETTEHVLRCTAPAATDARLAATEDLEHSLDDIGTHPDLISLISLAATTGERPDLDLVESDIALQSVMESQEKIGWHLLRYGFVAKAWRVEQSRWKKTQDPHFSCKKGERWARQLQESLWEYVSTLWNHRNKVVHGKDKNEVVTNRLTKMRREAERLIQDAPVLGAADRHLLQVRDINSKSGHFLRHWLRAVRSASRIETLRRKKVERENLVRYMGSIRMRQQRSGRRTLRQSTMGEFYNRGEPLRLSRIMGLVPPAGGDSARRRHTEAHEERTLHQGVTGPQDK